MMKLRARAIVAGAVLPLVALGFACRSEETTASRSAAAYDEAQRKGAAVQAGGEHGGHGGASGKKEAGESVPATDHSEMEGMGGSKAPDASPGSTKGMDHSAMGHSGMTAKPGAPTKMKGMDHSAMGTPGKAAGMAGMDHAAMGHGTSASTKTKGMDHSTMDASGKAGEMAGMDHAAMGHGTGAATAPSKPEPAAAVAVAGQPGTTLRPDAHDEAAPTSIGDAARASAMAGGGHVMQHGVYVQTDAGREGAMPSSPTQAAPTADPHQMHATPTPRAPAPQTGHQGHGPAVAAPKPSPTPDPHRLHRATPSPTPPPHKHPAPHRHEDHR